VDNGTTLQLSANLNPAAVSGGVQAISAPALSWPGLGILTLALGVLASRRRRRGLLAELPFAGVSALRPSLKRVCVAARRSGTNLYVHVRCKAA
jgi:hypothetical protein